MNLCRTLTSLALVGVLGAPLLATGESQPVAPAGVLKGKVVFAAEKLPELPVLDMSSKPEHQAHCMMASDKKSRELLVDPATKGIANVFLEIRKVTKDKWKVDGEVTPSDQIFCRYEPHVLVVPVGQPVLFKNSDPFMHNVHFYCRKNPAANFGVPEGGQKEIKFRTDEKIRVKCDVHTWMDSWVIATSNPFHALTGKDGSFEIPNVPPGEYEIRFWHEKLGSLKMKGVKIGEGETTLEVKSTDGWKS